MPHSASQAASRRHCGTITSVSHLVAEIQWSPLISQIGQVWQARMDSSWIHQCWSDNDTKVVAVLPFSMSSPFPDFLMILSYTTASLIMSRIDDFSGTDGEYVLYLERTVFNQRKWSYAVDQAIHGVTPLSTVPPIPPPSLSALVHSEPVMLSPTASHSSPLPAPTLASSSRLPSLASSGNSLPDPLSP